MVQRKSLRNDDPRLDGIRDAAAIDVIYCVDRQQDALRQLLPSPGDNLLAQPTRWAYHPWRRTVVRVLGPRAFRRVRLDPNLITSAESDPLNRLHIGVVGLSVGRAIAYALATQGLCGALRLTDFDDLELSNMNRVPATVFDVGLNKAVVCARRIAGLDPYLPVSVMTSGVTPDLGRVRRRRGHRHRGMRLAGRQSPGSRGGATSSRTGADGNRFRRPFSMPSTLMIVHRVSPYFAERLGGLQYNFRTLARTGSAETQALVLRFGYAPPPSVTSRRRAHIRHHGADGLEG